MTLSGILAGLTNPLGSGFALSRAAASVKPVSPVRRRDEESLGQVEPAEPAVEHDSLFEIRDIVDLSEAAANAELSDDEQKQLTELKKRDAEVRAHEQAHLAAAGSNAKGGATFEYQTGPDGRRYAVGGEVQIDTSPVEGDPQATIQKMQQIRVSALAPGEPSSQDRAVAAQAAAAIQQARADEADQESSSQAEESAGTDAVKVTGAHEFGARASVAAEHGIQKAIDQFNKSRGPGETRAKSKVTSLNPSQDETSASSLQRPRSDSAAGEILDLVA